MLGPVEPYRTAREIAALFGVSLRTVERMTAAGMPSIRLGRRTRRYRFSEVERWVRERDVAPTTGEDVE